MELPDEFLKSFHQYQAILGWVDMGKYIAVGVSGGCLGLGVLVGMLTRDKIEVLK
jgi:hypothetical protein